MQAIAKKEKEEVVLRSSLTLEQLNSMLENLKAGETLLVDDLDIETYHSALALSKTQLALLFESVSTFIWSQNCPASDDKTDALVLGSAFHTLVLEPEKFDNQFAVEPENIDADGNPINKNTNVWKDIFKKFKESSANKDILKRDDMRMLEAMRDSALSEPTFKKLLAKAEKFIERSIFYRCKDTNLLLKIRPDAIFKVKDITFLVDLKSTQDVDKFDQAIEDFSYHMQDAFYTYVYEKALDTKAHFIFVATSKKLFAGRYKTKTFLLHSDDKLEGYARVQQALSTYKKYEQDTSQSISIEVISRPSFSKRKDISAATA